MLGNIPDVEEFAIRDRGRARIVVKLSTMISLAECISAGDVSKGGDRRI